MRAILNSDLRSSTQVRHTSPIMWQVASGKNHVSRFTFQSEASPWDVLRFTVFTLWATSLLVMLSLSLSLLSPSSVLAQEPISPVEAMLAANQAYEKGEYLQAAAGYEAIVRYGIHNSDLYFNLGNAYFKHGDLGRAILNYRRAHRLAPRDSDILTNLTVARAQTVDRLEATNEGTLLANVVQMAEEWLTLREAAFLALTLWLTLCGLAVLAILQPRMRRWWAIGALVGQESKGHAKNIDILCFKQAFAINLVACPAESPANHLFA